MSWMQRLYETYERCAGREPERLPALMPICHTTRQAQIEIVLDASGAFRRASVLRDKNEGNTMIPCTEESDGRSGKKPVNHPLCDKLQYIAGDFLRYGGEVTLGFARKPEEPHRAFLKSLSAWATSRHHHPKLDAILRYVERGQVINDLVKEKILPVDSDGKLLKQWTGEKAAAPSIFKVIQNTQMPEEAFVRWRVEGDSLASATWEDADLISAWITYYQQSQSKRGCCMVTGNEVPLAVQHPAKLRNGADKAKLISSNDTSGYTFRGRFFEADQAASVGFEVTQKAHNALRWLIENHTLPGKDEVIVSWAVGGGIVPRLLDNTLEMLGRAPDTGQNSTREDTAQAFALRLARAIRGYAARLDPTGDIVVMALDSATEGRMAITFYRELQGSEFLGRIEAWHRDYSWHQVLGRELQFIGAPSLSNIVEAIYGNEKDKSSTKAVRKATVERLLPCIVDKLPVQRDLVETTVRRASNRTAFIQQRWERVNWEWEKCLGIACALFKGDHMERNYQMALEQDRNSRDYLYGRLLAIADNIESYALYLSGEKRDTTAARFTQRFADHPASTWRNIAMALRPYMARLRAKEESTPFLINRERLLDKVTATFASADFISDARLTGEFLLGYHCQRQALRAAASAAPEEESIQTTTEN